MPGRKKENTGTADHSGAAIPFPRPRCRILPSKWRRSLDDLTTAARTADSPGEQRRLRTRESLEGLSLGDAFGERFNFDLQQIARMFRTRELPEGPWKYTDDTEMALSVVKVLFECGGIDQDRLAESFAERFDPRRAYGEAACHLLARVRFKHPWRTEARQLFNGAGSCGNGAAMRVAPLGAYFADDLDAVAEQAALSAEVTHAHPEGIAGAVAVAVAAAWAIRLRGADPLPRGADFLDLLLPHLPDSFVRRKVEEARSIPREKHVIQAIRALGNGTAVTAQDTVPFVLWCAAQHLDHFEDAMWLTASGFGDVDTNCAMVGGIVAAHVGAAGLPPEWLERRESLPDWPFNTNL
ncbi:MAG: ADP-ribosylglycohydrolase family protein [Armatimonadetes bacterium]|nr:ADP-ribosylglycohydrolase family protein [Armatimonadota bacterium]